MILYTHEHLIEGPPDGPFEWTTHCDPSPSKWIEPLEQLFRAVFNGENLWVV